MPLPVESLTPPQTAGANPFALQQEQIQRRQQIADALLQQSMQPAHSGEMVSGHFVNTAGADSVRNLVNVLIASKMRKQNFQAQSDVYGKYAGAQSDAIQAFLDDYKQDPKAAITRGFASPYPAVQTAAKELLGKTLSAKEGGELGEKFTPESVAKFGQSNNPSDLIPRSQIKAGEGVQELVGTGAGARVLTPGGQPQWEAPKPGPNNSVLAVNPVTHEPMGLHTGTFVSVANMPENALLTAAGKPLFEQLTKSRENALGAQTSLAAMNTARQMLTSGQIWQNYGAQYVPHIKSVLAALGEKLSPEDEAKLSNEKTAQSVLLNATMHAALAADSARGMNTIAENTALRASAQDESAPIVARLGALDAVRGGLANVINQHHIQVMQATSGDAPELQKVNPFVRSAYDVPPIKLEPDLYDQDPNGMYLMKAKQPPAGKGVPRSVQKILDTIPGAKYGGPVETPATVASPEQPLTPEQQLIRTQAQP